MTQSKKGNYPTTKEQAVIDQLAKYIETQVIAEVVVEEVVDYGAVITFEDAKIVYLDMLENFYDLARSAIKYKLP